MRLHIGDKVQVSGAYTGYRHCRGNTGRIIWANRSQSFYQMELDFRTHWTDTCFGYEYDFIVLECALLQEVTTA